MAKSLGKLKRFNLQEYWGTEFDKFSSWLIQEEILEMIGETIALELAPAKHEIPGGMIKGGVVAKNMRNNALVLIQGQLGAITQSDFGKLISCAAGVEAAVVVWVASKIPSDHRKALDWLNVVSREHINFYGAELELWRIDDSAPAPNFNLVCQPTQWGRAVNSEQDDGDTTKSIEVEAEHLSPKKEVRKGDWTKKPSEKFEAVPQDKSSAQSKEDIAVRENFVYTKSF